jgi:hypothetical protein
MFSSPLPHRPTAWSVVAAAANSFSEEAQRKLRKYCPHDLPNSATTSIKFNENTRGKKGKNRIITIRPKSEYFSKRKFWSPILF